MPLVDPPIANNTRKAFSNDFGVIICDGHIGSAAKAIARAPTISA
jgi:hypothetical protein